MKVRLILPLVKFFDAVDHSTRLDDADLKYRYKMAARRCAFWYRDQNFDPKIDGPQDEWWQDWISILKPEHPKGKDGVCWGRVSNIRRDNIDKLKTGSALIFAAAIHQRFHATPDTAAQRLAKFLDRLAFGEPVKERLGPVCEFVEKPEIQGAAEVVLLFRTVLRLS